MTFVGVFPSQAVFDRVVEVVAVLVLMVLVVGIILHLVVLVVKVIHTHPQAGLISRYLKAAFRLCTIGES